MKQSKLRLMPSLRENKRYMALLVKPGSDESVKKKIDKSILDFLGEFGYAESAPSIIKTGKTKKGKHYVVLSINRSSVEKIKSAFLMKNMKCMGVSGTIKGVRRFL